MIAAFKRLSNKPNTAYLACQSGHVLLESFPVHPSYPSLRRVEDRPHPASVLAVALRKPSSAFQFLGRLSGQLVCW